VSVLFCFFISLVISTSSHAQICKSFESELKKNLNYFHGLWDAQQSRRAFMEKGDKSWQKEFLAAETWRNLRMTCRGFFGYCRAVLAYADSHPDIKSKSISPSHSNSSVLEAYFSLVRMYHQDDAPSFLAFSKSKQMISAHYFSMCSWCRLIDWMDRSDRRKKT
jgi:hypothetical protein